MGEGVGALMVLAVDFFKKGKHMEHRFGGFDSLVANCPARASLSLIERVACQNTKCYGFGMVQRQHAQSIADGGVDVLVMGGFAANDASQTNDRIPFFGFQQPLSRQRDLPGAGNPCGVDVRILDANFQESLGRTIVEFASDVAVVAGDHDPDPRTVHKFWLAKFSLICVDGHGERV